MKIALFGGAFDPPHLGHQRVVAEMIARRVVDEVWLVPVYEHPWAERLNKWQMTSYRHRKAMVKLILSPGTKLMEYQDVSFAYFTLQHFSKKYPEHGFSWVIGSEYLPSFKDWKLVNKVLNEFRVYVYPRAGYSLEPLSTGMTALAGFPKMSTSSTEFRQRYQSSEKVDDLVDKRVLRYIKDNNLYQN
jgi:nicotinate-nucleotide adenylyltransferase